MRPGCPRRSRHPAAAPTESSNMDSNASNMDSKARESCGPGENGQQPPALPALRLPNRNAVHRTAAATPRPPAVHRDQHDHALLQRDPAEMRARIDGEQQHRGGQLHGPGGDCPPLREENNRRARRSDRPARPRRRTAQYRDPVAEEPVRHCLPSRATPRVRGVFRAVRRPQRRWNRKDSRIPFDARVNSTLPLIDSGVTRGGPR